MQTTTTIQKLFRALAVLLTLSLAACHSIDTRIEIDAPPAAVWKTFSDYESYGEWNPFLRRLEGKVAVGEKLEVEIQPPGGDGMVFTPTVTEFEAGKKLEWLGGVWGIFTGRHRYELQALGPNRTLFKHSEKFGGLLVLFYPFGSTEKGFELMNQKLKATVERKNP